MLLVRFFHDSTSAPENSQTEVLVLQLHGLRLRRVIVHYDTRPQVDPCWNAVLMPNRAIIQIELS
jgi:hypothetical protein